VEELRYFAVVDQRSLEHAEHGLWAPPVRELLLTEEVKQKARLLGAAHVEVAAMCEYIANGQSVEGMESLSSALAGKMSPLHELLPPESSLILVEPERINSRALDVVKTAEEFLTAGWHSALLGELHRLTFPAPCSQPCQKSFARSVIEMDRCGISLNCHVSVMTP
jgi:transcription-repair coupling factor (superfamily II helicase)